MTNPYRLGKIAGAFGDVSFLMVHMGGVGFYDLLHAAIETLAAHPNIMEIGSAICPVNLLKAIKTVGSHRVCFGSNTPFILMHVELVTYRALLDGELSGKERDLVMAGNISKFLGLTD